jgi:hypothetical protein
MCRDIELIHEESLLDWPSGAGPKITDRDSSAGTVTVSFNQKFETPSDMNCADGEVDWVAFVYDDPELNQTCSGVNSICYGDSFETTVQCGANDNFVVLSLYVSDNSTNFYVVENANPDSCDSWTSGGSTVAKYEFEIPCKVGECKVETSAPSPPPSPGPTHNICPSIPEAVCPGDVEQTAKIGGTGYSGMPIRIVEQSEATVTFTIDNTFGVDIDQIYAEYQALSDGDTNCTGSKNVTQCDDADITYTAHCVGGLPMTIVDLWVDDSTFNSQTDIATVPECCSPEEPGGGAGPKVQYTFIVYCETTCNESRHSRLLVSSFEPADEIEGFGKNPSDRSEAESSIALETTGKGFHYCLKEDFPCGPNNENVNVCHYSSRYGYKTFCVPEDDSDVLAYYPKDHCGPCSDNFAKSAA